VAKTFHKVLLAAGLAHFRLYDLRHTYASHLIAQGADIAYVAKQLGHAKMTTTLLFYGHWFPKGTDTTSSGWTRHRFGTTSEPGAPDVSEAPDFGGGPSRTRTLDPLIKRRGPVMSRPSVFARSSAQSCADS